MYVLAYVCVYIYTHTVYIPPLMHHNDFRISSDEKYKKKKNIRYGIFTITS